MARARSSACRSRSRAACWPRRCGRWGWQTCWTRRWRAPAGTPRSDMWAGRGERRKEVCCHGEEEVGCAAPTCLMTLCLRLMSSKTASMTRSVLPKCVPHDAVSSVRGMTRDVVASKSYLDMRFFLSLALRLSEMYFSPRETPARSRSLSSTRYPFSADTWAMPASHRREQRPVQDLSRPV